MWHREAKRKRRDQRRSAVSRAREVYSFPRSPAEDVSLSTGRALLVRVCEDVEGQLSISKHQDCRRGESD